MNDQPASDLSALSKPSSALAIDEVPPTLSEKTSGVDEESSSLNPPPESLSSHHEEVAPAAIAGVEANVLRRRPSYWFLGVLSVVSLVADLLTKTWAEKTLETAGKMPTPKTIVPRFFGFLLAKNQGGAWGLLQNAPENVRKPFFVVVSVLAILFIVSLYRKLHPAQTALRWGLPLVLGGALGNLVDRIRYGYVIDFIDVQATWGGTAHHWPTFNVADMAICIGVILMALDMLSPRRSETGSVDRPLLVDR